MRPREHYTQQLEALHTELRALGQMVVAAITQAVDALGRQDDETATQIIADDQRIDQAHYALEDHAIGVIATQQPVASDLRRLVATIAIASELERIGDYAKSIAKATLRNVGRPPLVSLAVISEMAGQSIGMLNRALDAFVQQDAAMARSLSEADDLVDALNKRVRTELLQLMQSDPSSIAESVDLLFVAHYVERIADRTTNIAERIVFVVSGEIIDLNP